MNEYLVQFEAWLQEEDKGEKTILTYLSVMTKFSTWYEQTEGKEFHPDKITTLLIQDYRSYLLNTLGQKPATINKALATLKTFFEWAVDAKHANTNPALKVKMKRVQQTHAPKWLAPNEQNRLLCVLDTEKNEFKQARDRAAIYIMLYAGLRVEEVSELKIQHVDLKQGLVTVTNGKGGKYRTIPMNDKLRKALKSWISYRTSSEKEIHQQSDYLFVTERASKMTTRALGFLVDVFLERCGLLERAEDRSKLEGQHSCHSLRHTFCKNLVDVGANLQDVARLAGHDNIQTTKRYCEPSEADLRKAINKVYA